MRCEWMAVIGCLAWAMTGCAGEYGDYLDGRTPPGSDEPPGSTADDDDTDDGGTWPETTPWLAGGPAGGDVDPHERVIAPPPGVSGLAEGEVTDFAAAVAFLYEGAAPVQAGVDPGDIDPDHVAVIRGRVLDEGGQGVAGVLTSIPGHPEFGYTMTRADGGFDLAVDGGRALAVSFVCEGYVPAMRTVRVPWRDYAWADDVVLLQPDAEVTVVDLAASPLAQVARGSLSSDDDGARRATVLFPQGTTAWMEFTDGSEEPLTSGAFRATEFTVGPDGETRMPASLPPSSAYTYAVELGFDEAVAAGAASVTFDRPVGFYVEDFLDLPVGSSVPAGYLDPAAGAWVRSDDGRVLQVLTVAGGEAEVDVDGTGLAATSDQLAALGVDEDELAELAVLYAPGQTLWRVPMQHFTAWDLNFGYGLPVGAVAAGEHGGGPFEQGDLRQPCTQTGSIIECQTQVLGEEVSLPGTPFSLVYRSSRVSGFVQGNSVHVGLIGADSPQTSQIVGIHLQVEVAGRVWDLDYPPDPDQSVVWTWDGLDAYGREVQGAQPVEIEIGYEYQGSYTQPQQGFGSPGEGVQLTADPARSTVTLWQTFQSVLGGLDHRVQGLGGWSLDVHHHYDPVRQAVYFGDGTWQGGQSVFVFSIDTAAELPLEPAGMDVAWDGAVYAAVPDAHQVVAIHPDGTTEVVAGSGSPGFSGDGSQATAASLYSPQDVAVGPDGSIYIADRGNNRVRRVGPDGVIDTVAGTQSLGYNGDHMPATEATLHNPSGVAVADDGTVYIADTWNERVRQVGTDGVITTHAGNGTAGYCGDGGAARDACLYTPMGIDVAYDGSVYVADQANDRVRVISADGLIDTFAGTGEWGYGGDGGLALDATFRGPVDVTVNLTGDVFVADLYNHAIRWVRPDGTIDTFAGKGEPGFSGDDGPAREATMAFVEAVATSPAGDVYVADTYNRRVRKVGSFAEWCSFDEVGIPSLDGRQVFVFDSLTGRHHRTVDALTGETALEFGYDAGLLVTIEDRFGNVTTIGREGGGEPSRIEAASGQDTVLQLDEDGWIDAIELPGGRVFDPDPHPDGLLYAFTRPGGGTSTYGYDALGLLVEADDAVGAHRELARVVGADGQDVEFHSGEGRIHRYGVHTDGPDSWWASYGSPAGGWQETWHHDDASLFALRDDGTEVVVHRGPDPRWELFVPVDEVVEVRTPGGVVATVESLRLAGLDDPDDPLSLQWQQDSTWVNGKHLVTTWEAADDSVQHLTPEGRERIVRYDQGLPVELSTDPMLEPMSLEYTPEGRLERLTHGDLDWSYGYDGAQQLTEVTDALGRTTSLQYDDAGHVDQVTLPSGRQFGLQHDPDGNLVGVVMPSGALHQLGYSALGQPTQYTAPSATAPTASAWDLDGEVASVLLPSGRTISHVREVAGGRLTDIEYDEGSVALSYTDGTSRPSEITATPDAGPAHTLAFDHDGFLLTGLAATGAADGEYTFHHNHDLQVQSVLFASGGLTHVTDLAYDDDGLVVERGPFGVVRLGPAGAPSVIMGGGAMLSYGYDDLGRTSSRRNTAALGEVYDLDLEFAADGRIVQRTETVAGTTHVYEYGHDLDGQLTALYRDGVLHQAWTYDVNGNRISGACGTATFDDRDRLLTCGGTAYTHDDDGFLTGRGADTFHYSARGELLEAVVGGQTVTYAYDGFGRRIRREDGQGAHEYFYGDPADPFRMTAARLPDGSLDVYHRDDQGLLIAIERGAGTTSSELLHVATDQVGTPRAVFAGDGTVIKTLLHDPFGALQSDSDPTFDLPLGFAGGLADPTTGLVRFGLRDYDPTTARWTAPDPLLYGGGQFNLYAYVNSDPVDFVDPSGLVVQLLPLVGLGFGVGFTSALIWELGQPGPIHWRNVFLMGVFGGVAGTVLPGLAAGYMGGAGLALGTLEGLVAEAYVGALAGGLVGIAAVYASWLTGAPCE